MIKLFPGRVVAKPALGLFEPAARSAFRTLGLAATAAQAEVFDAASGVRLALKLGVRKTFAADLEWLGAPARGEPEVRDAVGRLSEPAQRARERLFWFHGPVPAGPAADVAALMRAVDAVLARGAGGAKGEDGRPPAGGWPAALHDAALLAVAGLMRLDPALAEGEAWAYAFGLWRRLYECEEFWTLLVAADLKGGYEPAVTFGEVAELRRGTPRLVSAHAAERARRAALKGNADACLRALRILRGAGLPRPLLEEYEREAAGPFEDALTEKLDAAFAWVELLSVTEDAKRRNYCNEAWRRFEGLRPQLAEFAELAGADSPPARRVFEHAASKLLRLAESFDKVGRREESLFVCLKARALAPPGSAELVAAEERLRELGAGKELEEGTPVPYAETLARALADARVPPKLFRDDPKGGKTFGAHLEAKDSGGCLTSALLWLAMVAGCSALHWCGVIKTTPRRTPIESLPRMTFTPPPLNLNLNYNVAPLNLPPYVVEPPAAKRPRDRRRKARPQPPPTSTNAAPPPNSASGVPANPGATPPRE